ncbi:MAG: transglutaminase domain-containing protein [Bacteroidota bacterium]
MISAPIGIKQTLNLNGNTSDIVNAILYADAKDKSNVLELAQSLKGLNDLKTCKNIWEFIKKNITYKIDPSGQQFIKSPAKLWKDKTGDCKSFSIFYASILKALKIPYKYRFASYSSDQKEFTHVYVIANNSIVCDAVMNEFNTEKQFNFKKDYDMTKISYMAGVGATPAKSNKIETAIVNFDEFQDLAILALASSEKSNIRISGRQLRIELTKTEVERLLKDANDRFLNSAEIASLFGWFKKALNKVNVWVKDNIGISLWDIGSIYTGGVGAWVIQNQLGQLKPMINATIPTGSGGMILTGDANAIALLNGTNLSDEEKTQKDILLKNIGNALFAQSLLNAAEYIQANATAATPKLNLFTDNLKTDDSGITTAASNDFVGAVAVTKDFNNAIFDNLAQGFGALSYEWVVFKIGGGVGAVQTLLANWHVQYINSLTDLGLRTVGNNSYGVNDRDFFSYKFHEIINVLEVKGYKANKTNAAMRIMNYEFGTNMQAGQNYPIGFVKMPTPASKDLSLSNTKTTNTTTQNTSILTQADALINKGETTLAIYNILIGGGMSSNSALAYLVSKGRSVVNILQTTQQGGTGKGNGGVILPPAAADNSKLLTYGGVALLAFKILS